MLITAAASCTRSGVVYVLRGPVIEARRHLGGHEKERDRVIVCYDATQEHLIG